RVTKVMGIVNGTTNFILTRMAEEGLEFGEALAEAERLGYTELDPTADIEGFDPAAKAAILASIAFNARVVSGDVYREGVGDIIDIARNMLSGGRGPGMPTYSESPIRNIEAMYSQYYILLNVADQPGVLASVASAFGSNNVSIGSVWQEGTGDQAQLVMITHRALERDLQATLGVLRVLPEVTKVTSVMRVEGGET